MKQEQSNEVVLSELNTTFATVVNKAVDEVLNGNSEAHNVIFALKAVEDITASALERLGEAWLEEAMRYADSRGAFDLCGYACKIVEGNKKDYATCNDTKWNILRNNCDMADAERREREKFLQSLPKEGTTIVDELTGEITTIYQPSTVGKTYVRITRPKGK